MQIKAPSQPQQIDQNIKSRLVKYYESKKNIPHLISQANQTQLTLDESFINLKLMDDDQNNKDSIISVEKLLESSQKKQLGMVIKGGPGSGKSTLLDKVAYTWAMNVNDSKKVDYDYIFRIDLKKLGTAIVKKEKDFSRIIFFCLIQAFQQKLEILKDKEERQKRLIDELSGILNKGNFYKFMFLLDGYDQVKHFQGDQSKSQSNNLTQIFKNVKNHSTIITSRPQATQGSKSLEGFKRIIQIQPLQEASINNFINIMFKKQDTSKGDELKRQAKSNKNVMKIMQSPLNLTMVCLIFISQAKIKNEINFSTINQIFLYDKIIKLITLRQEKKEFMNDLNKQDLQKTVSQGTLYEEIEPLNLLKETVYNIFKNGNLVIKKEDIGRSSNKKYDEKRKAIVRTIDFGLLKKKDQNKVSDIDLIKQDEQYAFIHLSFAEYLFAYSIFQKLKNYIPANLKNNIRQTSKEQLQEITSFIANNRYKTTYFNSFRYLTMLCSKYYNQQKIRYKKQLHPKKKKKTEKLDNDIDQLRYMKFPLETIWICFVCNIDGVIQFGKQQKLKLIIDMLGLSNYKNTSQSTKIEILNIVKAQQIESYFSVKNEETKERNKNSIVRWSKYFVSSNYFSSQLTQQLVIEIQKYFSDKDGVLKLQKLSKLDEDFIVAFCQIISCVINSKNNYFFNKKQQNKLKCLDYFLRLLEKTQSQRIIFAVLSNLQDLFHSLQEKEAVRFLFQSKQGESSLDLIQILLKRLCLLQTNQITFKLLCYFSRQEQQIKQKSRKEEQQKKADNKLAIEPNKNGSIRKRVLLSLKKELIKILQHDENLDIDQGTIFSQVNSQRLQSSDPIEAEQCINIQKEIKQIYWQDIKKKIDLKKFDTRSVMLTGQMNNLIKKKMYILFEYYLEEQLSKTQLYEVLRRLDKNNIQFQMVLAEQQTNQEMVRQLDRMIAHNISRRANQPGYLKILKTFYLNRKIVNGYGNFIKGDGLIDFIKTFLQKLSKNTIQDQLQGLSILCERFIKLLKFMGKSSIAEGVSLIVNAQMNPNLSKKLFEKKFQQGVTDIFTLFKESFLYIGKQQIKKNLVKIISCLQNLAKMAPKISTVQRKVYQKPIQPIWQKKPRKTISKKQRKHRKQLKKKINKLQTLIKKPPQLNQQKTKQDKQAALIIIINFLWQTMSYNTQQVMINIIRNIIIPLCTFFDYDDRENSKEFNYNNPIKIVAFQCIKSSFSRIKSQKLLIMLIQMSKLLNLKKQKRSNRNPKKKLKNDEQFIKLQIIGVGINFLKENQKLLLIQSQLHLFQHPNKHQLYRKGTLLIREELSNLASQNQSDIKCIFVKLLNGLSKKSSKVEQSSIINCLVQGMPLITDAEAKSQLMKLVISILSDKKQLIESTMRILIYTAPYLKDQTIKFDIIVNIIPFLSNKKKMSRIRAYLFLKQAIKVPYENDKAINTVYKTLEILKNQLLQVNFRSKINAILIINEALPILNDFNFDALQQSFFQTISPMITSLNVKLSKCAIYYMGNAISIVKKYSESYYDITMFNVYKLLKPESKQLSFNALQYMKKSLPYIKSTFFMEIFATIINYLNVDLKVFQKRSRKKNEQQFTPNEKTIQNMAFNYYNVCLQKADENILAYLFSQMIIIEQMKQPKLLQSIIKNIKLRANNLSFTVIKGILYSATIVLQRPNETSLTKTKIISLIQKIINPANSEHVILAKTLLLQFIIRQLRSQSKSIKLSSLSLIKRHHVCFQVDQLRRIISSMTHLLSDQDDDVCVSAIKFIDTALSSNLLPKEKLDIINEIMPLMQKDSLKLKQNAVLCLTNILPSLRERNQYRKIVDTIVKVINNFIKSRQIIKKPKQDDQDSDKIVIRKPQIISGSFSIQVKANVVSNVDNNNTKILSDQRLQDQNDKPIIVYRHMIHLLQNIFPDQDRQLLKYFLINAIYPAFSDKDELFRQIGFQFIQFCIIKKSVHKWELLRFIQEYFKLPTSRQIDHTQLIQTIIVLILPQMERDNLLSLIELMVQFFNRFDEDNQRKIQQLIRKSSINVPVFMIYDKIIPIPQQYRLKLTYELIYLLQIIIQRASRQQAEKISLRVKEKLNDEDIKIRQKARKIIQIAVPKISPYKTDQLVKIALKDIITRNEVQQYQMLNFFTICIPYLNSKTPQNFLQTFETLLNDKSQLVGGAAIKFMQKSLKQCIKEPQQKLDLISKLLPLFNAQKLGLENSISFVQMVNHYINKKEKQDLLKKLQQKLKPFFMEKDDSIFLIKIKKAKNILTQLDPSIKTQILTSLISFLSDKEKDIQTVIKITHIAISVFPSSQKKSFQILQKLISHLKHNDQQIKKRVEDIIKIGIFCQKQIQNRALLLLDILIFYSEEKHTIENSKVEYGSVATGPLDVLMKIEKLKFDLSLLHREVSLMDVIHVIHKTKGEDAIIIFRRILELQGVLERESKQIVILLSKFPSLNVIVAQKIKSTPEKFTGSNFTILIELSKANNQIYGVISQFYLQILQDTQKEIINQGEDPKLLQQFQQKIKNKEIDQQSFFTQQLLKKIVMMKLSDKQLNKQDSDLLNICVQCDLTISFRYYYDVNKDNFENMYEDHYSIDLGDKRFLIKEGSQNIFAILRKLFKTEQGLHYAKHNNIFKNYEKNGLKKAAIDTADSKEIFLNHKKIIKKIFKEKEKMQEQILHVDWDTINMLHLTYQQNNKFYDIYLIMRRDQFGNITARKFQNQYIEQSSYNSQSHSIYSDYPQEKKIENQKLVQNKIDNRSRIKMQKYFKDYVLHLNSFAKDVMAFKMQLIGQKSRRKTNYEIQCVKITLDNYESSQFWSFQNAQQFFNKMKIESIESSTMLSGKFPKWVLLGQEIKPYQCAAEDIQNIEQILQITGLSSKSKLKKALKKLGKTQKEKEMLAQYSKVAFWKLINIVESYGLVDCGILKKDESYRSRDDQYKKEDMFILASEFFGENLQAIPYFGQLAKSCVQFLSEKAKANIDKKQQNLITAFVQLFQESSSSVQERNLLIDEVILQLTKKRMKVLFSSQKQKKVPFLFDVIDGVKSLKDKIDNILLQQQLQTHLSSKRTSIMAKMDIATLAMAIMSKQSKIVELCPQRQQIPSLLMTYLDQQINEDEKSQTTGCMARIKQCLIVYENCFRSNQNEQYQFGNLTCWQRVKKYLGVCFCCCQSTQVKVSDKFEKMHAQSRQQLEFQEINNTNHRTRRMEQSYPTMSKIFIQEN